MKTSEQLFELIKSLNKSEKGYFKKFSSMHTMGEKNNYVRLFDAIEKQKSYDEQKLLQLFNEESFVNNFSVAKAYLYNIILQSLESYHHSINSQIQSYLHRIEILFEKGLYEHGRKILLKAKELANQYEKHTSFIELLNFEKKLMRVYSYHGKTEEDHEKLFQQMADKINACKIINEYDLLSSRLIMKLKKEGDARDVVNLKKYQSVTNHRLLNKKDTDLPYHARLHLYTYHTAYFNKAEGNLLTAYHYAQKQVNLMESNPHLMMEDMQFYSSLAYNLLLYQLRLKKYDEMQLSIQKLKSLQTNSKILDNNLFYITHVMELTLYIDTGRFNEGVQLAYKIENVLSNNPSMVLSKEKEMILYYEFFNTYFGAERFRKANYYLNKILNEPVDIRNDIQDFARILSLIVHFELGNMDLLEYTVKSTYRFLYKRNRLYQFETILLRFIRKVLPKIHPETSGLLLAFKKLKIELEKVVKDPFERKALDYFDFISWLESKIEKRAFAEVVREKTLRH